MASIENSRSGLSNNTKIILLRLISNAIGPALYGRRFGHATPIKNIYTIPPTEFDPCKIYPLGFFKIYFFLSFHPSEFTGKINYCFSLSSRTHPFIRTAIPRFLSCFSISSFFLVALTFFLLSVMGCTPAVSNYSSNFSGT